MIELRNLEAFHRLVLKLSTFSPLRDLGDVAIQ